MFHKESPIKRELGLKMSELWYTRVPKTVRLIGTGRQLAPGDYFANVAAFGLFIKNHTNFSVAQELVHLLDFGLVSRFFRPVVGSVTRDKFINHGTQS